MLVIIKLKKKADSFSLIKKTSSIYRKRGDKQHTLQSHRAKTAPSLLVHDHYFFQYLFTHF